MVSLSTATIMDNATENLLSHEKSPPEFAWIDYGLFFSMLILSVAIGIYFGCFGSKQRSKTEYLLGGKTMKVMPVAISLIASEISGITLLGVPTDIYTYGANYIWGCIALILASLATSYIYLPVFHKLQLTSIYEYLKLRFDRKICVLASLLFTIAVVLYNSIVIYIPALALEQSTGISVHLVAPIICASCIFYTTIGGLKTVVWTDTVQMIVMAAAMVMVFVLGIISAGGITNIIDVSSKGHRLDIFYLNIDPTVRDGICALIIGSTAHNFGTMSISQACIQRYLALPSLDDARKAVAILAGGVGAIKLICVITGLIMYTKYTGCDPLSSGVINRADQILPYYIMDVAGHIPGLSGLFIAGIFSASLSTLSATLNTLTATVYEDFILPWMPKNISEKQTHRILKLVTIITGVICTALVFIVEKMGGLLPLASSFSSITGGPLVGLFTLGMIFPVANAKGALCGAISGLAFVTWVVIGNQWYKAQDYYVDPVKPISVDQCSSYSNITSRNQTMNVELPFYLYRVTFWYYTMMGMTITIIVGIIVSCCTKDRCLRVPNDLLCPFVVDIINRNTELKKIGNSSPSQHKTLNLEEMDYKCENNCQY